MYVRSILENDAIYNYGEDIATYFISNCTILIRAMRDDIVDNSVSELRFRSRMMSSIPRANMMYFKGTSVHLVIIFYTFNR